MPNKDFTTSILVSQAPQEVFKVLTNARNWWSGLHGEQIGGSSEKLNDEFTFTAGGGAHYSKQKLTELVPGEKITWLVTDSKLTFLQKPDEWTGTRISFDLSKQAGKTKVTFTHSGLVPAIECYKGCAGTWTKYLERLAEKLQ